MENYQVIGGDLGPGRLQNVVNLLPGVTVRAREQPGSELGFAMGPCCLPVTGIGERPILR